MNRKRIEIILGTLTMLFALFSWLSVRNAITVATSSTWAVPMTLFSVYIILACLSMILFREVLLLELVLIGSLVLSLFFAFSWFQLGVILLGAYFLFLSSRKIRQDMDLNVKINVWKSLQTGKSYLLIAFSLMITIQYFVVMSSFDGEKKVPHFDTSFITKKIALPIVSALNPQFKVLQNETLTVDQFILQTQNSMPKSDFSAVEQEVINEQLPSNLTPAQKEIIMQQASDNFSDIKTTVIQKNQEIAFAVGRKQLSDIVGFQVTGDEKIADVFTGLINNKINDYFNPKMGGSSSGSVFVVILAIILFLTIFPLGSVISIVWFLIVELVIIILLKTKVLEVKNIKVSKEVLG